MQKKGCWTSFREPRRYEKAARIPQLLPNALSSRTEMVRGLSPKGGSAAVGSLRDGVRTATEEITLLLGSGAALMARQWDAVVPRVRARVAGVSSFGADRCTAPRQRLVTVSQNWWPRTLHRWTKFLKRATTRPPAQRPRDRRAHEFLRDPAWSRIWVPVTPTRRTTDNVRTPRVRPPSPCLGCVGRPQCTRESPKQNLRRWSPSHPASLVEKHASLEHLICAQESSAQQSSKEGGQILLSSVSMRACGRH